MPSISNWSVLYPTFARLFQILTVRVPLCPPDRMFAGWQTKGAFRLCRIQRIGARTTTGQFASGGMHQTNALHHLMLKSKASFPRSLAVTTTASWVFRSLLHFALPFSITQCFEANACRRTTAYGSCNYDYGDVMTGCCTKKNEVYMLLSPCVWQCRGIK